MNFLPMALPYATRSLQPLKQLRSAAHLSLRFTRGLYYAVLLSVWEQFNKAADNDFNVDNTNTLAIFDASFRELIRVHATPDDRCELVLFLRACSKP
jgi:hypothetical protein